MYKHCQDIIKVANATGEWKQVVRRMQKCMGFGGTGFMTKEAVLDTTYTCFWERCGINSLPCDWNEWTPVGPGSLRGAAILADTKKLMNKKL